MATTTFIIGDDMVEDIGSTPLQVQVTITEVGGSLEVTLQVLAGYIADLRGFFFNLADDTLIDTLTVIGADITDKELDIDEDGNPEVDSVPPGEPNINPGGPFYVGIEIGSNGIGSDDIPTTTITIDSSARDLTLEDILGQEVGIRATSVGIDADLDGVADGGRNGSSKLVGEVPRTFSISGTKIIDVDGDGNKEAADTAPHVGVTIFMDSDGDGELDSGEKYAVTDANGNWTITGLTAEDVDGPAKVRELAPDGFVTTIGGNGYTVSGAQTDILFGNFEKFDLSGTKYEDMNGDGEIDLEDKGLAGVTIFIDANDNGENDDGYSTTTDADGKWSFKDLGPGLIGATVYEELPSGYVQTLGKDGYGVKGTSGADQDSLDFANFEKFDLSGTKYEDMNGNGEIDAEDKGLAGVTIFIDVDNNGKNDDGYSTTTDADGKWSFNNLGPGLIGATIYEELPSGYVQTLGNDGYGVTGTSGADQDSLDFANFEKFDLSGHKWNDTDKDGYWDAGEQGIKGWTIYLDNDSNLSNGVIATAYTDANGAYSFNDLGPGTYYVYEGDRAGWTQTYGGVVTIDGMSGTNEAGEFGKTEELNFGNHSDAPGVRTPGFWGSTNGLQFWDGLIGNESKAKGADGVAGTFDDRSFADDELLPWNDSNGAAAGGLKPNAYMILGGDHDEVLEAGELQISLELAKALINASQKQQQDGRWMLGRDAVATELNILAGNPAGDGLADNAGLPNDDDPMDLLNEAVAWLKETSNDTNNDGTLSLSEFKSATAVATSSPVWQNPYAGFEHSASVLHSQLDEYNNDGTLSLGGIKTTWATDADLV